MLRAKLMASKEKIRKLCIIVLYPIIELKNVHKYDNNIKS